MTTASEHAALSAYGLARSTVPANPLSVEESDSLDASVIIWPWV
jgi:hypothetical protein